MKKYSLLLCPSSDADCDADCFLYHESDHFWIQPQHFHQVHMYIHAKSCLKVRTLYFSTFGFAGFCGFSGAIFGMRVEAGFHQWPVGRGGLSLAKKVAALLPSIDFMISLTSGNTGQPSVRHCPIL